MQSNRHLWSNLSPNPAHTGNFSASSLSFFINIRIQIRDLIEVKELAKFISYHEDINLSYFMCKKVI